MSLLKKAWRILRNMKRYKSYSRTISHDTLHLALKKWSKNFISKTSAKNPGEWPNQNSKSHYQIVKSYATACVCGVGLYLRWNEMSYSSCHDSLHLSFVIFNGVSEMMVIRKFEKFHPKGYDDRSVWPYSRLAERPNCWMATRPFG